MQADATLLDTSSSEEFPSDIPASMPILPREGAPTAADSLSADKPSTDAGQKNQTGLPKSGSESRNSSGGKVPESPSTQETGGRGMDEKLGADSENGDEFEEMDEEEASAAFGRSRTVPVKRVEKQGSDTKGGMYSAQPQNRVVSRGIGGGSQLERSGASAAPSPPYLTMFKPGMDPATRQEQALPVGLIMLHSLLALCLLSG